MKNTLKALALIIVGMKLGEVLSRVEVNEKISALHSRVNILETNMRKVWTIVPELRKEAKWRRGPEGRPGFQCKNN